MVRISTTDDPGATTITVDGQFAGDYIDAVETCVRQAIGQQKPVRLFLRDVSQFDERGHALLSRLAAEGVELSASGVYSSYVVDEIRNSRRNSL